MVNRAKCLTIVAGVAFLGAGAAVGAQVAGGVPSTGGAAAASAVSSYYANWQSAPKVWFRNGAADPAVAQLSEILKRAPFDGLASGPQLAAQVDAAVQQASSGKPDDIAAAERVLSTAWVEYVQQIKQPTRGMIYAYPVLKPQGSRADQILLTAAAAPSLTAYLNAVATVNPVYSQIRDAAWAEARATGNLTPDPRLLANLERARSIPATGRFIVVDSATQRLTMYENGQPYDSMKVIVGMNDLPTPMIASVMYYVTFNPYWNAPDHLVRKAIAPKTIAGGMKYFNAKGYEVMTDWSETSTTIDPTTIDWKAVAAGQIHLRIRQKPGKENFMGILKFPFPNPEDIYLHDTPAKDLFAKSARNLSNGCVRVEDAKRLGRWLLGREPVPPGSEPEIRVQMPRGVPIFLTYLTAQPKDGKVTYVADIYGWDKSGTTRVASGQ